MRPGEEPQTDQILLGENLELLPSFADGSFQLIYIDPPFNTGRAQTRRTLAVVARRGRRADRLSGAALPHATARRVLLSATPSTTTSASSRRAWRRRTGCSRATGTLYFHIDYREAHYCKLLLDEIFGRECFLNEIIWAYDYGARAKRRWPAKHDTILVYVKDPAAYHFDSERGRPRALHGARARQRREGRARQAADRRLVAHDRPHQRRREDRLPDAEARGDRAAHRRTPRRAPATGASTSSPAAARSAPSPPSSAAATC